VGKILLNYFNGIQILLTIITVTTLSPSNSDVLAENIHNNLK